MGPSWVVWPVVWPVATCGQEPLPAHVSFARAVETTGAWRLLFSNYLHARPSCSKTPPRGTLRYLFLALLLASSLTRGAATHGGDSRVFWGYLLSFSYAPPPPRPFLVLSSSLFGCLASGCHPCPCPSSSGCLLLLVLLVLLICTSFSLSKLS